MGKKRKTLPKEIGGLLESGNIEVIKEQLSRCEPNALTSVKYGSNIFSLSPLPREIALWAKEQGADVNFKDYYNKTPIFSQAAAWQGDVQLLIDLGAKVDVADDFGVTPLHLAALYGRLDAVRALLDAGVDVNVRDKRGIKDPAFLRSQTEGMEKLYRLFDVAPAGEVPFHDGVSPILVTETGEEAQFRQLWDFLVPPNGRAQTAQGEIIRIAGRIENELMGNGGINWDEDFRKMLRAFPQYVCLGNAFSQDDIQAAEALTSLLTAAGDAGRIDDFLCKALCASQIWGLFAGKAAKKCGLQFPPTPRRTITALCFS